MPIKETTQTSLPFSLPSLLRFCFSFRASYLVFSTLRLKLLRQTRPHFLFRTTFCRSPVLCNVGNSPGSCVPFPFLTHVLLLRGSTCSLHHRHARVPATKTLSGTLFSWTIRVRPLRRFSKCNRSVRLTTPSSTTFVSVLLSSTQASSSLLLFPLSCGSFRC